MELRVLSENELLKASDINVDDIVRSAIFHKYGEIKYTQCLELINDALNQIYSDVMAIELDMDERFIEPEVMKEYHTGLRASAGREVCRLRCKLAQTHPIYTILQGDLKVIEITFTDILITSLRNYMVEYFSGAEEFKCYLPKRSGLYQVATPHANFAGSDISWPDQASISIRY